MRFARLMIILAACLAAFSPPCSAQQSHPRARDLGIPFEGTPGTLDAITDVSGVEVGFQTLISGSGKLVVGQGPVRTGVTAVFPRGKDSIDPVFAGWFTENGNGEMTGTTWVEESGFLTGPVLITNTHSVGVVRDAVINWEFHHGFQAPTEDWWSLPVVAETWDGYLNDINGFHVTPADAFAAMDSARSGPVEEGNIGGGTGMICFEFKGGTGTPPVNSPPSSAATPWASLFSAISVHATCCESLECPSARRYPERRSGRCTAIQQSKIAARSSSLSPLMPRFSQRNSTALHVASLLASAALAAFQETAPATFSSPFPRRIPAPASRKSHRK